MCQEENLEFTVESVHRREASGVIPHHGPRPRPRPRPIAKQKKLMSLPPREAHTMPPPPDGTRPFQSFDIPMHAPGSSRVFSRMRKESRGRSGKGTGKTFEAYQANISRFLHRCGLVAREHGLDFDGDVGTVAPIVAWHGLEVYRPVIDAMQQVEKSSPKSRATCIDAFIYMCRWLKRNMAAVPDAVGLITLMNDIIVNQAKEDKKDANHQQRLRRAQVSVESMQEQEDGRWITKERLEKLGNDAYKIAMDHAARIEGEVKEGRAVPPGILSDTVSAVVATVVLGTHSIRPGPMSQSTSQLGAADMKKVLDKAENARFVPSGQHKNSRHEGTATISVELSDPKVHQVLRLYQDVLRPLLAKTGRANKRKADADADGHFWITKDNTPMDFGRVFARFVEKMTRGEAPDGKSGLRVGITSMRKAIATAVEQGLLQGNLSAAEADTALEADGHSRPTAVAYYALDADNEQKAAGGP